MDAQTASVNSVNRGHKFLADGLTHTFVQRHKRIWKHFGDIQPQISEMLVILGRSQLASGHAQHIHQITGNLAVHGHAFFNIIHDAGGGKLKGFKG